MEDANLDFCLEMADSIQGVDYSTRFIGDQYP